MPSERRDPRNPQTWLRRARSNLARARAGRQTPEVLYEDLCFDAQQAAEKAIKAVLVAQRAEFPKVHAIERLLNLAVATGLSMPSEVQEAAELTDYATLGRYPNGMEEDVTEDEYRRALELAELVVRWAEEIVGGGPA